MNSKEFRSYIRSLAKSSRPDDLEEEMLKYMEELEKAVTHWKKSFDNLGDMYRQVVKESEEIGARL